MTHWWKRLLRRNRMEEDLEKEMRFHLDQHTADLIAQGHHPEEAQREARLAFGGHEQVKENCRDARGTVSYTHLDVYKRQVRGTPPK